MMLPRTPTSILLFWSGGSPAETLDAWLRTHFMEPLEIGSAHTLPEAIAYLQSHRVDLVLVDEAAARTELRAIHTVAPATAIIALVMRMDPSILLHIFRQGVHEALSLLPSADVKHPYMIERALARVNGRPGILKESDKRADETPAPPRLIHDLNNLLTTINGFADLLLNQLTPDHPARMGVEHIRLAGKRAATLLKAQSPADSVLPSHSSPATPPITARAA